MAEIKGIDVSRWNGKIDWKTVASYGMGFAILRITEKGNIVCRVTHIVAASRIASNFFMVYSAPFHFKFF